MFLFPRLSGGWRFLVRLAIIVYVSHLILGVIAGVVVGVWLKLNGYV